MSLPKLAKRLEILKETIFRSVVRIGKSTWNGATESPLKKS
jgi:hypothetical protein